MNRKKYLFLLGFIVAVIIIVTATELLQHKNSEAPQSPTTNRIEKGSASPIPAINIQNTGALYSHLLSQQFSAVKQAVAQYIQQNITYSAVSATIVPNSTVLNYNGSINFSVQVATKPPATFGVLLQIPNAQVIIFTVPSKNYSQTLYPYGSATTPAANSATGSSASSLTE